MTIFHSYRQLPTLGKLCVWTLLLVILYALTGFFALPALFRHLAVRELTQTLERKVAITSVKANPFKLSLSVNGFTVLEKNSDRLFLGFDSLYLDLDSSSLFKVAPVIEELRLEGPSVRVQHLKDSTWSFSDLLPSEETTNKADTKETRAPLRFALSNIQILGGNIVYDDLPLKKTHTLEALTLNIPFLSNLETHIDIFMEPLFEAKINGSPVRITGRTKPFTDQLTSAVSLNVGRIDLGRIHAYLPEALRIGTVSGYLDLDLKINFAQDPDTGPTSSIEGNLALSDLYVTNVDKQPLVSLERFSLALLESSFLTGKIAIGNAELVNPNLYLFRMPDDRLNLMAHIPADDNPDEGGSENTLPLVVNVERFALRKGAVHLTETLSSEAPVQSTATFFNIPEILMEGTRIDTAEHQVKLSSLVSSGGRLNLFRFSNGHMNIESLIPPPGAEVNAGNNDHEAQQPWIVDLKQLHVDGFAVSAGELAGKGRGTFLFDSITVDANDVTVRDNSPFPIDVSAAVNRSGRISGKGSVGILPLKADVDLQLDGIKLSWAQPFIDGQLNLILSNGQLSSRGTLSLLNETREKQLLSFGGDVSLADLAITDKTRGTQILSWDSLDLNAVEASLTPPSFMAGTITASAPKAYIEISPQGKLNLIEALSGEKQSGNDPPPASADTENTQKTAVDIKTFRLTQGNLVFHDRSITPDFKASIAEAHAEVSGLTSTEAETADVNLKATLNNAPVSVKGTMNPLGRDLVMDMDVSVSNLDLVPASAYAGKYAGYNIQKGKFSCDLGYRINDRKLDSTNRVFLDQFTFGDRVKSPDAIDAPVSLAVSLLKDPSGRITLDLPVRGSFDDPEFSVGAIIVKMIMNLLAKAATAPFSLLGAMFGGGDDLNVLTFDPGMYTLTPETVEKLDTIAKALEQRPGLKLEVGGIPDPAIDTGALIQQEFEHMIRTKRLSMLSDSGDSQETRDSLPPPDDAEFSEIIVSLFTERHPSKVPPVQSPAPETGSTASPSSESSAAGGSSGNDGNPPENSKVTLDAMIQALKAGITPSEDDIEQLAQDRARGVITYLTETRGVDAERIFMVKDPALPQATGQEALTRGMVVLTLR